MSIMLHGDEAAEIHVMLSRFVEDLDAEDMNEEGEPWEGIRLNGMGLRWLHIYKYAFYVLADQYHITQFYSECVSTSTLLMWCGDEKVAETELFIENDTLTHTAIIHSEERWQQFRWALPS